MGILRQIHIVFEDDVAEFSHGGVIKGAVVLDVDGDRDLGLQRVKGVWIQFKGVAKIEWTNTSYNRTSGTTESDFHTQREDYLKKTIVLFGTGRFDRDIDNLSIPPGRTSHPFALPVPSEPLLPQSFQGIYGYIRYTATATVSVKRMRVNTETKTTRPFIMTGPKVDLNIIPSIETPVKTRISQSDCCGCGTMVERVITIGLPKRGYVTNDVIYVVGKIDNRDGEEEIFFDATLVQRIIFTCGKHTRTKEYSLCRASKSVTCLRGWVTDFKVGPLHLATSGPPSGVPGCDLIDVEYYVKCSGCKFTKTFPVIVGTVPIRGATPARPTADSFVPVPADTVALHGTRAVHAPITTDGSSKESSDESEPDETKRLFRASPPDYDFDSLSPPNYHQVMKTFQSH
ncbi:arrestin domain-containing protein 3-like [Patiria miniata]|uniref:Arrestin-like N-terminal domain-containing protein n=1 Tax=Patiria miniata TaxID=46514 RepID=A0A914B6U3_PATMI|nr:arrestin domain-containing protein 3-like [Patiria miniata]